MTTSLDTRLENGYITSSIEAAEDCLDIHLDSTWINNRSSNKKIGIPQITVDVDSDGGYYFSLSVNYSIHQGSSYCIYDIPIYINVARHRMSDLCQVIADPIKGSQYVPSDIDSTFDYMDEYGDFYIHATMTIVYYFTLYLMSERKSIYFILSDDNTIDSDRDSIKVYSFNSDTNNW
jgi:hypothetical protein